MSRLLCLSLKLPSKLTEQDLAGFEVVFSELLDSAAVSYRRHDSGEWVIESLFYAQPDLSVANTLLAPLFQKQALAPLPLIVTDLPARDWLAENRAAFPPRKIGRFWVHGSHTKEASPAGYMPLLVDASLAFGSGTHPTTEGCLRALQMIPDAAPSRVLDMGCGSAILAMAANRLWPAAKVIAADNDPVALRVTAINRRLNNIAPVAMHLALSNGFGSRYVRQSAPFDVIFANILAQQLIKMAPDVCRHLARHAWLILSGILNEQVVAVRNVYQAQKILCWQQIHIGEWATLVMRPASFGAMPRLWRGRSKMS